MDLFKQKHPAALAAADFLDPAGLATWAVTELVGKVRLFTGATHCTSTCRACLHLHRHDSYAHTCPCTQCLLQVVHTDMAEYQVDSALARPLLPLPGKGETYHLLHTVLAPLPALRARVVSDNRGSNQSESVFTIASTPHRFQIVAQLSTQTAGSGLKTHSVRVCVHFVSIPSRTTVWWRPGLPSRPGRSLAWDTPARVSFSLGSIHF